MITTVNFYFIHNIQDSALVIISTRLVPGVWPSVLP